MADLIELAQSDDLAHELALGFFPENVICFRHGVTAAELARLKGDAMFLRKLQDAQLSIAKSGDSFQLMAAEQARSVLGAIAAIAKDPDCSANQRTKAAELLGKWAGYEKDQTMNVGAMQIVLATNLEMGRLETIDGSYEVVSNDPSEGLL